MHDIYTLGAMLAVILVGLLYNGKQINDLRDEMGTMRKELSPEIRETRTEVLARIDGMQRDMMHPARE